MEAWIKRLRDVQGDVGFYCEALDTGAAWGFGEDRALLAASAIKLPILVSAFRLMHEGKVSAQETFTIQREDKLPSCGALSYLHDGLEVTLYDLCVLMIILSDNTATNLLIGRLGMDEINRTIDALGLTGTRLNRPLFDAAASARGLENTVSAKDMATLLRALHQGTLVSKEASAQMLTILKDQRLNGKIPFALPRGIQVAHKTGEDEGITHDVGIVYAKRPFILCFLSNDTDVPAFERLLQDMAAAICRQMEAT